MSGLYLEFYRTVMAKVHDLGGCKKILTYAAPISHNPDFQLIFYS